MLKRKARKMINLKKSKLNKLSSKSRKLRLSRKKERKPEFNPLPLQTNLSRVLIS